MSETRMARYDLRERAVHWAAALSFLYLALTGLALWSHKLYWLAAVFGGGTTIRVLHPWAGLVLGAAIALMFARWWKQMTLDADDRQWLGKSLEYAMNREEGLPEPGRFNAGQKMLFWTQSGLFAVLLASGLVLWFPESMPRALRLIAILVHPLAAIGAIGAIILHIYMGTAAVPGALKAMVRGTVTPRWALSHHPKWYREIRKG